MRLRQRDNKWFRFILILISVFMTGCGTGRLESTSTATATITATNTSPPTATATYTQTPSTAAMSLSVPTSYVANESGESMLSACRLIVDRLMRLKSQLGLPEHYMLDHPARRPGDFDPNQYFDIFTHLDTTSGYKLDFVYFTDELGGKPLVYARKASGIPFRSYEGFLASFGEEITEESSDWHLPHKYDYLANIQIDGTSESFFEFHVLAFLGDKFYLWGHGLYSDAHILCESSDLQYVYDDLQRFDLEFPQDVEERLEQIDFMPVVVPESESVTVRFVYFSKWEGFIENVFIVDREDPMFIYAMSINPIIEYDFGMILGDV